MCVSPVEKFNVKSFPTLLVLPADKPDEPVVFVDKLGIEAIHRFLRPFAKVKPGASAGGAPAPAQAEEAAPASPVVHRVKTAKQFEDACLCTYFAYIVTTSTIRRSQCSNENS